MLHNAHIHMQECKHARVLILLTFLIAVEKFWQDTLPHE